MDKSLRGVSPVIGTVLLISITVILAGTIGFFVMQQGTPEAAPTASLAVQETSDGYELVHNGGDDLVLSELRFEGIDAPFNEGKTSFEVGEVSNEFTDSDISDDSVTVIHKPSNTILFKSDLS